MPWNWWRQWRLIYVPSKAKVSTELSTYSFPARPRFTSLCARGTGCLEAIYLFRHQVGERISIFCSPLSSNIPPFNMEQPLTSLFTHGIGWLDGNHYTASSSWRALLLLLFFFLCYALLSGVLPSDEVLPAHTYLFK